MSKEELVPVGKITGVHGIKGEVKVTPYGDLGDAGWDTVFLTGKGAPIERKVLRARRHKSAYLFELEGVRDRNAAEGLAGLEISVRKSQLPEAGEDEYYYFDLIGMEVRADDGRLIGRVTDILATGSNDVLIVKGPFGEVLVPAIEDVIVSVDPHEKRITVRLMEGILPEQGP